MSRYAEAHKAENIKGVGDARPTALDIVRDEKREGDLTGKVVVITGTSSGIGPPTAIAMAATGATVYCIARDLAKAKAALGSLLNTGKVHLLQMDQTDLASVKACADELHRREKAINILINNAGVMSIQTRTLTKDGFETQMGTNHFAHFYFFCLLRDLLEAGSTPEFASRVVNVSSSAHRWSQPDFDDLTLAKEGAYTHNGAYGASKTANVWMANKIDRLYGSRKTGAIHGYSVMPGGISTPLQRHYDQKVMAQMLEHPVIVKYMKSPEQGAATSVFGAVARELEGKGRVYLDNCEVASQEPEGQEGSVERQVTPGYAPWAFAFPEKEDKLWEISLKAVGLPADF